MSPRDRPFGSDTLALAAYLSTGPDDPGLAAWKSEHPDWFEAGTWTRVRRPDARSDQGSASLRSLYGEEPAVADNEQAGTRAAPIRWQSGRDRLGPNWAVDALRSATLPIGFPAMRGSGATSDATAGSDSQGDFELYPPQPTPSARVERISDAVDPITARIRDVDSQLRIIIDTTFRDRVAGIDRTGSAAAFGSRLHAVLRRAVDQARIPGVETESSFIRGDQAEYGDPSSIRTDILLRINSNVVAV